MSLFFLDRTIAARLAPLVVAVALAAGTAQAVTPSTTPGCDYEVRGGIAPGLAARIPGIGRSYDGVVLCLDGASGSLESALDLFDAIWRYNVITHVPAGWRCAGACAIAFLGGSINTGTMNTRALYRSVHPRGELVFYMPDPDLRQGGTEQQMQQAFARGIEAMARFDRLPALTEHGARAVQPWLHGTILSATPDTPARFRPQDSARAEIPVVTDPWDGAL